eukprot:scaffold21_cov90-Isochrysis_galbana.AAC.2
MATGAGAACELMFRKLCPRDMDMGRSGGRVRRRRRRRCTSAAALALRHVSPPPLVALVCVRAAGRWSVAPPVTRRKYVLLLPLRVLFLPLETDCGRKGWGRYQGDLREGEEGASR